MLDDIVSIISRDAVMRSILAYANVPRPPKKVKIPRDVYPRKTSHEFVVEFYLGQTYSFCTSRDC